METGAHIGKGIFTIPDIGKIFGIPTHKVRRWVKDYWDERLSKDNQDLHSWTDGKSRAVNFLTLIELYTYIQFMAVGVSTKKILRAHEELATLYESKFPFATNEILNSLRADGKNIYFETNGDIISLDGKRQFKLAYILEFISKLDFGSDDLATRFWPMGKENSIVIDPSHRFGQPTIEGTNLLAESLYKMYEGGDSKAFLCYVHGLDESQVDDVISFYQNEAA